jgi:hypothetical protein
MEPLSQELPNPTCNVTGILCSAMEKTAALLHDQRWNALIRLQDMQGVIASVLSMPTDKEKRTLFGFIGKISHWLFGTTTGDQLTSMHDHVQEVAKRGQFNSRRLIQLGEHLTSVVRVVHASQEKSQQVMNSMRMDMVAVEWFLTKFAGKENSLEEALYYLAILMRKTFLFNDAVSAMQHAARDWEDSLQLLVQGYLPSQQLVSKQTLVTVLHQVTEVLQEQFPRFPRYSAMATYLLIMIRIPLVISGGHFKMYSDESYSVQLNGTHDGSTKVGYSYTVPDG